MTFVSAMTLALMSPDTKRPNQCRSSDRLCDLSSKDCKGSEKNERSLQKSWDSSSFHGRIQKMVALLFCFSSWFPSMKSGPFSETFRHAKCSQCK